MTRPLTDTERLDAIGEHGLCITTHDQLKCAQWERTWVAAYGSRVMLGPSIRHVIDAAVLDLSSPEEVRQ